MLLWLSRNAPIAASLGRQVNPFALVEEPTKLSPSIFHRLATRMFWQKILQLMMAATPASGTKRSSRRAMPQDEGNPFLQFTA